VKTMAAYSGHREHPDRSIVNAKIGHREHPDRPS